MASVVYLQRKTHLAGAQRSLLRLMSQQSLYPFEPILFCEDKGWLYQQAKHNEIDAEVVRFSKGRSLQGRLFGNRAFAQQVVGRLHERKVDHLVVHGNEYDESLLALAVARQMGCHSVISLRNDGMQASHWRKHKCGYHARVVVTNDEMRRRVLSWEATDRVRLIPNGLAAEEFGQSSGRAKPIRRIAIIGSALPIKGWEDAAISLRALDRQPVSTGLEVDFVGRIEHPDPRAFYGLNEIENIKIQFLGLQPAFVEKLRDYDLVVNPSRGETFGMAMVEIIAAGLPLLTTRTGIAEELISDADWLVTPQDHNDLTRKLLACLTGGLPGHAALEQAQLILKRRFSVAQTASLMSALYEELITTRQIA